MIYEIATLTGPLLKLAEIEASARAWMGTSGPGTLVGSWRTDIGALGRVILLRSFETQAALTAERRRALFSADPFDGKGLIEHIVQETYEGFAFLPPAKPCAAGIYEIRTYFLKPGGLQPTLDGWQAAIEPASEYTDHLVINMFALDGPPRITHIWGFETIQQRFDLRERHYAAGLWPPKGGPDQILRATSTIAISR